MFADLSESLFRNYVKNTIEEILISTYLPSFNIEYCLIIMASFK